MLKVSFCLFVDKKMRFIFLLIVYALYNMAYSIGMFVGPVIAGYIMSFSGFESLMLLFSVALLVCSPIMINWGTIYQQVLSLF